jgi:tRNA uracil 4-sulfurtransferase
MGLGYDVIIIHYSEIYLKTKFVKNIFERLLISNIEVKTLKNKFKVTRISRKDNSLYVFGEINKELVLELSRTFGVTSVSPAYISKPTISSIKESISKLRDLFIETKPLSFGVKVKKDSTLLISHKTIAIEVASYFPGIKVDLRNPDLRIIIDTKIDDCYIYTEKVLGPGGLPYGSEGRVVALISNGIDSPVSAWLSAKRGCEIVALHFGESKPLDVLDMIEEYTGENIRLINISDYEEFQESLYLNGSDKYQCILCKIGMYIIANEIAKIIDAKAIITGENLGQVASQTLDNLYFIDKYSELPVFRPLISFNKEEIINLGKIIGTYKHQINIRCKFVPDKPATIVNPDNINFIFEKTDFFNKLNSLLKKNLNLI